MVSAFRTAIRDVVIYKGHRSTSVLGPYFDSIAKRVSMFEIMNKYREHDCRFRWNIHLVEGEDLTQKLSCMDPQKVLLVVPAGESSDLDKVFSSDTLSFLKEGFLEEGGRAYVNCGSAYWVSRTRIYEDLCATNPRNPRTIVKKSRISLFDGTAIGPLCKYPDREYKVGFFSDAVDITGYNGGNCTIFLSGGGSFVLPDKPRQETRILTRYTKEELLRLGKTTDEEQSKWETASLMARIRNGAVLLSMYHPYYGPRDIDTERYTKTFPNSKTNWKNVHDRLSALHTRVRFMLDNMIYPLEDMKFAEEPLAETPKSRL